MRMGASIYQCEILRVERMAQFAPDQADYWCGYRSGLRCTFVGRGVLAATLNMTSTGRYHEAPIGARWRAPRGYSDGLAFGCALFDKR
jgi:hypothetical protein